MRKLKDRTFRYFDKSPGFCQYGKTKMDKLAGILQSIIGRNAALKVGVEEAQILSLWEKAVGDAIAKHAKAIQLRDHTLLVSVDHPIWKQELHSNKRLALGKMNELIRNTLGSPPGERPEWISDIFLVSPNPANENPSKGGLRFRKK